MYVLEFCSREYEGSWANLICVSKDRSKLEERAIIEQVKYLNENGDEYFKDFQVGFLANIVRKKKNEILATYSEEKKIYNDDGVTMKNYKEIQEYLREYAFPFAKNLSLEYSIIEKIVKDGFYESKSYEIREVEEI